MDDAAYGWTEGLDIHIHKNLISPIVAQLGIENQGGFLFGMLALSLLGLTYNATVSNRTVCMCIKIYKMFVDDLVRSY